METKEKTSRLSVILPEELHKRLKMVCVERDMYMSVVLLRTIRKIVDSLEEASAKDKA